MDNKEYFNAIGLSEVFQRRVETVCSLVKELYNTVEFLDLFICNQLNGQQEEYTSLWLLSSDYIVECKDFLTKMNVDLTLYKQNIKYFNLSTNKDSISSIDKEEDSKLFVKVFLNNGLSCTFTAYSINCKSLLDITNRYLIPNIL